MFLQGAQLGVPLELRLYPEALLTGTVIASGRYAAAADFGRARCAVSSTTRGTGG